MSGGYTQVAVVHYRRCTTSCDDYSGCACEFQQSHVEFKLSCRHAVTDGKGGYTTKYYRNTVPVCMISQLTLPHSCGHMSQSDWHSAYRGSTW